MEGISIVTYSLPFKNEDKIIELGGGTKPYFRPNLDVRAAENVDIVANFHEPLPINDKEYDGLFSSYCIEHIGWRKLKPFLNECYRILKNNSKAVFITANTERQMKWVLDHDEWDDNCSCIIFGDQDYDDNTHKNSLNPKYAIKLFTEAGFKNVIVVPHGELTTDMIIEASKQEKEASMNMTSEERKSLFDQHYFNGGQKVGGYAYEGYWDYPVHWVTFNKIMELKPKSVLEIGAARGYLVKRFEAAGIPAKGLEISTHCHLTRVTDSVLEFDICQTPWPFKDKEFDLCYSIAVMEHIPEQYIPEILKEIDRVTERGLHGIDFGHNDDGFDKTHCTLKDKTWWESKFSEKQIVCDKELLEQESLSLSLPSGDGKLKLNIGSFTVMFHNGWINTDVVPLQNFAAQHHYKFLHHDIRNPFQFENETVDLIVSSHVLEHITAVEGEAFLQDLYRIMKHGAVARIAVPDAETLVDMYKNKKLDMFDEINNGCKYANFESGKLWSLLFEGHRMAYDYDGIKTLAESVGFKVSKKKFNEGHAQIIKETMDFLPDLSLYVELTK